MMVKLSLHKKSLTVQSSPFSSLLHPQLYQTLNTLVDLLFLLHQSKQKLLVCDNLSKTVLFSCISLLLVSGKIDLS